MYIHTLPFLGIIAPFFYVCLLLVSWCEQHTHHVHVPNCPQANIVTLHDIVHTADTLTFVFEYLKMDLKQYLDAARGYIVCIPNSNLVSLSYYHYPFKRLLTRYFFVNKWYHPARIAVMKMCPSLDSL